MHVQVAQHLKYFEFFFLQNSRLFHRTQEFLLQAIAWMAARGGGGGGGCIEVCAAPKRMFSVVLIIIRVLILAIK